MVVEELGIARERVVKARAADVAQKVLVLREVAHLVPDVTVVEYPRAARFLKHLLEIFFRQCLVLAKHHIDEALKLVLGSIGSIQSVDHILCFLVLHHIFVDAAVRVHVCLEQNRVHNRCLQDRSDHTFHANIIR